VPDADRDPEYFQAMAELFLERLPLL
jgi:hypothetical protein